MKYLGYILLIISSNTFAQVNGDWIESGQMKLRVNADGQMATFNNNASSEFISGSNNHMFKFINLWISGYDTDNQLHITTVNGFADTSDYSPGPIDSLTYAGADPAAWNYVWSVTASEIKDHRTNFQNSNYILIDAIKNWPSNGTARFNKYLAPFVDYDKNGIYEPAKGDYPDIIGEKATYFITNDNYSEHKASGGQPLKIEIYGMAYSLADMPNTIFTKYFIINRTDKDFSDIKISFHSGFQLGNDKDNYCGTLVPKNMVFSYNGDANDDGHFGTNKPLASFMVLNKELASTLYITNDADANTGMPLNNPVDNRNMMEGKWKSSKPLTYGTDGTGSSSLCKFVYPGNTDPSFTGQKWEENTSPGQRSILANLSYQSLLSKGFIELDIAVSGFDRSDGDPYLFLDKKANDIKNAWSKEVLASLNKVAKEEFTLKNPVLTGENIYQNWFEDFREITVYNTLGQIVNQINPKVEKRLIIEETGIYYISLKIDNQIITKKILIL